MSRIKEVLGHSLKEQEQSRLEQDDEGEGGNGSNANVDSHLSIHCKRYFSERVEFSPARYPDTHLESLKDKYQPINTLNDKMDSTSISSPPPPPPPLAIQSEIPKPKKVLFDPDCLSMNWTESRSIGSGLSNMGNTCFLNSVLQCLSYTPPLVNYILSGHHKNKCTHQGFCAMCEYHSHLIRIRKSMGVVKPLPIVHNLRVFAKHFRNGHQEDAHEFLRYFIDSLQKISLFGHQPSKLDVFSKHTTVIHQIFGGYHRSQVKCLKCKRTSNTYDPLLDISLDIKGCPSLQKALFSSIKPDLLDEENKYACPFCKELTKAKKQLTIHVLPKVLTIQLKRFEFNTLFGGKINKGVHYPEYLDMRPFMSDKEGPKEWYRLYAVLVHYGYSCHSGHYYCYVKNSNGIWYSMNDSMVNQVSKSTVLSQQAYLLFYIKDSEYAGKTPSSSTSFSSFSPSQKNQPISSKVSSTGVPVKRSDNERVTSSPLTPSKPTGVVTPSPKYTSVPPPPPLSSDTNIFNTGSKKVELPSSSNKPSPNPPVTPSPDNLPSQSSIQTTPMSFSTPPKSTSSIKFTPRSVSAAKSKPVLSADETSKSKKPRALVQPMRSMTNKKPVARVLPSPQQVTKSDNALSDEVESVSNTVCDDKLKENESTHSHSDNVSSVQPSPAPTINSNNNKDVEHDRKNEKDVKSSKDDDLAKKECELSKQNWIVSDSLPLPSTPSPPAMFGPSLPPDFVQSSSSNWTVSDMNEHLVSKKKKHSHKKTVSVSKASPDDSSAESSDTDEGRKRGKDGRHKEGKRIKRKRVKEKEKNRSKEKESRDHFKEKRERDRSKRDTIKEREDPKKRDDSSERDDSKHHRLMKKRRHRDRSSSDESEEEEMEKKRRKQTEHSHKKHKKHHSKRHHSNHSESSDDESNDGRRRKRQKSPSPLTPSHSKQWKKRNENDRSRGREKDELLREKTRRKMQELKRMKESDKLFDDCLKNKGSNNVTEIKWDSKRSSHRHDSTGSDEPNVLDSLDKSDQLGDGVKTWNGEKNSIDSIKNSHTPSRRRGRDDWDREIDRGKVKKSKIQHNESWDSRNKFQNYQNKRNFQNNKKFNFSQ